MSRDEAHKTVANASPLVTEMELDDWDRDAVTSTRRHPLSALSSIPEDEDFNILDAESLGPMEKISRGGEGESLHASDERWSMSDDAPLLVNDEQADQNEETPAAEVPKQEKKPLISAEYKIAFSHFMV